MVLEVRAQVVPQEPLRGERLPADGAAVAGVVPRALDGRLKGEGKREGGDRE